MQTIQDSRDRHEPLEDVSTVVVPRLALARHSGEFMQASVIALRSLKIWTDIDAHLSPVIGRATVVGLYKRSLSLIVASQPILISVYEQTPESGCYKTLQDVLSKQSAYAASYAQDELLATFQELLSQLVGASVTEKLIGPVLNQFKLVNIHSQERLK